jgi:hypothetical protein
MVQRQERLAENQERFRRANQRLREHVSTIARDDQRIPFLCECADEDCRDAVSVTLREYGHVRDDEHRFLIVPGHVTIEGEDVVAQGDGYAVVEKSAA